MKQVVPHLTRGYTNADIEAKRKPQEYSFHVFASLDDDNIDETEFAITGTQARANNIAAKFLRKATREGNLRAAVNIVRKPVFAEYPPKEKAQENAA